MTRDLKESLEFIMEPDFSEEGIKDLTKERLKGRYRLLVSYLLFVLSFIIFPYIYIIHKTIYVIYNIFKSLYKKISKKLDKNNLLKKLI